MASNISREQSVQFPVTINWFNENHYIQKTIVTSFNNIPLFWKAAFSMSSRDYSGIDFNLQYCNGPIEKFNNMEYAISILKPDLSIAKSNKYGGYEAVRGRFAQDEYFDKGLVALRAEYGLEESDPLIICITLKIPVSVFAYAPTSSPPAALPNWMTDLFADIQDPDKLVLISRDGSVFYCHKVVAYQSKSLQAIFRHGKPENELDLGSTSLEALVQFLHTGQADVADLKSTDLIELTDAAEMYNLKPLKEACVVVLWKEVKNLESCGEIQYFVSLTSRMI